MLSNEAIISIANAVKANADALNSLINALPHEAKVAVAAVAAEVVAPKAAPTPAPAPKAAPTPAPASAMPPPPVFNTQSAAPDVVPFNNPKTMLDYVLGRYKELGVAKGPLIQGVLESLGYKNINDIAAKDYPALYAGIKVL